MEIRELNLLAFGPFSEKKLAFDPALGALHVVYGLNEAGKSSALRGLKALLYGIDERSTDDFIHSKDKLRIAGRLCTSNGNELAFMRRKGRKNTLLSSEGEPLDENILTPFLQGIGPELFETLFGIDHEALVQGGREILEQKGEVGQALFSASLGSHTLHAVLGRLDQEADGLFRPRGSTQTINAELKSHAELKKEIREQSLSSSKWDDHRRELARSSRELEQVQSELNNARTEINRLQRMQRILPKLAARKELMRQVAALGSVVVLPEDFGSRRQKAVSELETANVMHKTASVRLESLQAQLDELPVRTRVLEHGEEIEGLRESLGSHRKAMRDRPRLDAEYRQLLADNESLVVDLRPGFAAGDLDELRCVFAKRQAIVELGSRKSVLVSTIQATHKHLREIETRLREVAREKEALPDALSPDPLRSLVFAARKSGDLDGEILSVRHEYTVLEEQCGCDLARLSVWKGSLDEIPRLAVPAREAIHRFEERFAEVDQRCRHLREKRAEFEEALSEAACRLEEIRLAGEVPSEDELSTVRKERETLWQLLRRLWIDGESVNGEADMIDSERNLPDAFEFRIARADELADRLRREAERVHASARYLSERKHAQSRVAEFDRSIDESLSEKQALDEEWESLWAPCGVLPRTPREMRAWMEAFEDLRARVVQLKALQARLRTLEQTRGGHIRLLEKQLNDLGKCCVDSTLLEAVLVRSEQTVSELEGIRFRRAEIEKEIQKLERDRNTHVSEHRSAEKELEEWKVEWHQAIAGLGLGADASPSEADAFIEKLRLMFAKQEDANKLKNRIEAIDRDAEVFRDEIGRSVLQIAPELQELSGEEVVSRLSALSSENRNRQSKREQIEAQMRQANREIQESQVLIQAMRERLDALCREAKCASDAELELAERKSVEFSCLRDDFDKLEKDILNAGEGASIEALEQEAEGIDPDTLPARIETLSRRVEEELEPKRTMLAEARGRAMKELELMDGNDRAGVLAEHAQSVLAAIRSNAERYVRLKLASRILRDEIERYRKENQGPLLQRASEHFAALTRGSFAGLRTDVNEKDEPVLLGTRPDETRVHVEGMSSGSRDQLYLALRLASLEKYMERSEALPFIVDDILVDFDDERSESALNALASLARKTQVILFTHHLRLVEQARGLEKPAEVQVHEL